MFKKLFYRFCDYLYKKIDTEYVTADMVLHHPYALYRDHYGNRIFYKTLKELKKRGYYNNFEAKKAAMDGTYRNYGWQYSAEQYAAGRSLDPKKYKDYVPANPKGKPWPEHILVIAKSKKSDQKVQHRR